MDNSIVKGGTRFSNKALGLLHCTQPVPPTYDFVLIVRQKEDNVGLLLSSAFVNGRAAEQDDSTTPCPPAHHTAEYRAFKLGFYQNSTAATLHGRLPF